MLNVDGWTELLVPWRNKTKTDKSKTDKLNIDTDSCIHMRLGWPSPPLAPWSKWIKSNTDIEKNRKKTKVNWFQTTNKRPVIEEQQRAKAWQHCGWYSDEEKRHRSSKCLDRPLTLPFSAIAFAPRWSSWITVGSSRRKPNSLAILRGGTFFGPCAVRKWDFNDYDTLGRVFGERGTFLGVDSARTRMERWREEMGELQVAFIKTRMRLTAGGCGFSRVEKITMSECFLSLRRISPWCRLNHQCSDLWLFRNH